MKPVTKILLNSKAVKTHRGATKEDIKQFKMNGSHRYAPEEYIEYLQKCGWADILGSEELLGLGPDTTPITNVDDVYIEEAVAEVQMRSSMIPLMRDGTGNFYCLDVEHAKKGECPVVLWQHDDPKLEEQKCKKISANFRAWVQRIVREAELLL